VKALLSSDRMKAPLGLKVGNMLATRAASRRIEIIPALLVVLLNDTGKLPPIPNLPHAGVLGFRQPGISDMESFTWTAAWESAALDEHGFRKVAGLAAHRDYYNLHDSSDVRELCSVRGSRRAVIGLIRFLRDDAEVNNRRLVGSIVTHDAALAKAVDRLGGSAIALTRWEYNP
jgi:hypothetical protein